MASAVSTTTKRHGREWCGAGARHAASTSASRTSRGHRLGQRTRGSSGAPRGTRERSRQSWRTRPRRASRARARRRRRGSVMSVSVTTVRTPSASTSAARDASCVVDHERVAARRGSRAATPTHDASTPRSASIRSAGPLHRGARDEVADADDARMRGDRVADPGHGEDRRDRHDRVGRADRRRCRPRRGRRARRERGARPRHRRSARRRTGGSQRSRTNHSSSASSTCPSGSGGGDRGSATSSSVIGSRRHVEAPGRGDLGGDRPRAARPSRRRCGAVQVGGEVAVADVEPGRHAVALERAEGHEGLAGEPPAGLGVVGARPGCR